MNILPRKDLREPAFRQFEQSISRACYGSLTIDPGMIRPSTWIARCRDAILAYERFGYKSKLIPPNYPLRDIKFHELEDGRVWLENRHADLQNKAEAKPAADVAGSIIEVDFGTDAYERIREALRADWNAYAGVQVLVNVKPDQLAQAKQEQREFTRGFDRKWEIVEQ